MAIHIGYLRAGIPGLIIAGSCFIAPAMVIVLGLGWFYVKYGSLPQIEGLLYGIKPVMIAVILQALVSMTKTALKSKLLVVIGLIGFGLYFSSVHPLLLLFGGALAYFFSKSAVDRIKFTPPALMIPLALSQAALLLPVPINLLTLFLTFLKIGAVLYGSGYVLLAFLQADFVARLGWLTEQQLLDAISIGQVTPGPVFTTATFIGYILAGLPGGLLATLGIFLPSFIFVAISNPFVGRLRQSKPLGIFLDGVNAVALGMMAGVLVILGRTALIDPLTIAIAAIATILLFRFKFNSSWLIAAGGLIGLARVFFLQGF